eukprot:g8001.t1
MPVAYQFVVGLFGGVSIVALLVCCAYCCCRSAVVAPEGEYEALGADEDAAEPAFEPSSAPLHAGRVEVQRPGETAWVPALAELFPMMLVVREGEGALDEDVAAAERYRDAVVVALNETVSQLAPQPRRPHVFQVRRDKSSNTAPGAAGEVLLGVDALDGDDKFEWLERISSASIGLGLGEGEGVHGGHTSTVAGCLEVLGLSEAAEGEGEVTLGDIKRAYHLLALRNHPDRGGDAGVFSRITEANAVLKAYRERESADRIEFKVVAARLERAGAGIGLELSDAGAAPLNRVRVSGFVRGSVAQRHGGIREGDIVSRVDGVDMRGRPLDAVFKEFMRGSRAGRAEVELEFLRARGARGRDAGGGADNAAPAAAKDCEGGGSTDAEAAGVEAEAAESGESESAAYAGTDTEDDDSDEPAPVDVVIEDL